jgi:hypothetical protein
MIMKDAAAAASIAGLGWFFPGISPVGSISGVDVESFKTAAVTSGAPDMADSS